MQSKNINNEISRCIIRMLVDEPFYAHFLSGIIRNISNEVPTAAVGLNGNQINLYINEDFFLNELKTFSSRVAVIKHETLHLVFKHLLRADPLKYNMQLYNIAADLVVNQLIGKWKLPDSAVSLSSFPDFDLKPNQSVEWYYNKLVKVKKQSKDNKSYFLFEKILNEQSHSDHSKWINSSISNISKYAETELDRLIIQAKNRISIEEYSLLPNDIKERINLIIEKRKEQVNWKRSLKLFSSSSVKTNIKFTNRRLSKRFGTRPGIKVKRNQKIAVAVDTSASINLEEINLFFNEIYWIWRNGAEIEVIECDAKVQKTYPFTGKFPGFIHGRGGTNFDPVFKYINSHKQNAFDGCIYFTDGYADFPNIKPACKVFWLITSNGDVGELSKIGRTLKIKTQAK